MSVFVRSLDAFRWLKTLCVEEWVRWNMFAACLVDSIRRRWTPRCLMKNYFGPVTAAADFVPRSLTGYLPRQRFLGTRNVSVVAALLEFLPSGGGAEWTSNSWSVFVFIAFASCHFFNPSGSPNCILSAGCTVSSLAQKNSRARLERGNSDAFCNFAEWLFLLRRALRVVFRHAGASAVRCVAGRGGAVNCWSWVYFYAGLVTYNRVAHRCQTTSECAWLMSKYI